MMDENFLLYKKRALELLDEMKKHGKAWSMYVFSSANAIRKYDMRQLVELGVSWVWMGFESAQSGYIKLKNADTIALTRELQSHGIRVQGSTIIGMEHHTPGEHPRRDRARRRPRRRLPPVHAVHARSPARRCTPRWRSRAGC